MPIIIHPVTGSSRTTSFNIYMPAEEQQQQRSSCRNDMNCAIPPPSPITTTSTASSTVGQQQQQQQRRKLLQNRYYCDDEDRQSAESLSSSCFCCCTTLSSSNYLYLIGSCLYVTLAIWDIHNENNWYTSDTTGSSNNNNNDDDNNDNYNYSNDHKQLSFQMLHTIIHQMKRMFDPYRFLYIVAASCYVIDASMAMIHIICTTRHQSQPQQHYPTNNNNFNEQLCIIRDCSGTFSTSSNNMVRPVVGINDDDYDTPMIQPRQKQPSRRFQPRTNANGCVTVGMTMTFGLGATLDLVSALTMEWYDTYPYLSTYAVVGAAHMYLLNAIIVLSNNNNNNTNVRTTNTRTTVLPVLSFRATTIAQTVAYTGNCLFLIGSLVDVSLSYFYIGQSTATATNNNNNNESDVVWKYIYRGYLFSSILWLLNALCHILADIVAVEDDDDHDDVVHQVSTNTTEEEVDKHFNDRKVNLTPLMQEQQPTTMDHTNINDDCNNNNNKVSPPVIVVSKPRKKNTTCNPILGSCKRNYIDPTLFDHSLFLQEEHILPKLT